MESYRTERGPRQRVVAHLGDLDEAGRIGVKEAASGNSNTFIRKLCSTIPSPAGPRWTLLGSRWSGHGSSAERGWASEVLEKLGLVEFLETVMPGGREDIPWSMMSLVLSFVNTVTYQILILCRIVMV